MSGAFPKVLMLHLVQDSYCEHLSLTMIPGAFPKVLMLHLVQDSYCEHLSLTNDARSLSQGLNATPGTGFLLGTS